MSEDTHALVRDHFVTHSIGEVDIRGRNRPVAAYEVTGAIESAPMAIAEAFRAGNLGIMDYYRLENIQSDTSMRKSISDSDSDGGFVDPNK